MAKNQKISAPRKSAAIDVYYDGEHHEVESHEAAWLLAWSHIPATITDLSR